jgi:hypothetical protein
MAVMKSASRFTAMIAGTQGGKRLDINTPIPTPTGFKPMGSLEIDDLVIGSDGLPTKVTYVSPIEWSGITYRLRFDDGTSVLADAEHLWVTQTRAERKNEARFVVERKHPKRGGHNRQQSSGVRTTQEIADTLARYGAANHSLAISIGPDLAETDLPIPPYTLGVWLGDGTSSSATITTADPEVLEAIAAEGIAIGVAKEVNAGVARGYRLGGKAGRARNAFGQWAGGETLNAKLRAGGLLGNKHIPIEYLFGSRAQRLALVQGLMDTDGYVGPRGQGARCEYVTTSFRLAGDVATLLRSLGIKVRVAEKQPYLHGKPTRLAYRLAFTTSAPVFRLPRKAAKIRERQRSDTRRRFVVACDPAPSVPMRCITVGASDGQYLCTTAYITTHNTSLGPMWLEREIRNRGAGDYLAVTATFPLLKQKMLPEFIHYFRDALQLGYYARGERTFYFHDNETRVMFGSAAHPESLESATAKAAWLDEAGQYQFRLESWEAVQRRVSLFQGRVLITTTPYNRGWLKTEIYDRAADGDSTFQVVQFASTLNPSFPAEEMERVKRSGTQLWKIRMFYEGLFDQPPGLIFQSYIDTYRESGGHLVRPFPIPPWWPRYVGVDFGGTNTAKVYLAHDPAAAVYYLYMEDLSGHKTAAQHAHEVLNHIGEGILAGIWGGAKSESAWRLEWAAAGVPMQEPDVYDVEIGLDRAVGLFSSNRLFVFETCRGIRDELGTYSRQVAPDGTVLPTIQDKNTYHRIDALRALSLGIGGPPMPQPLLAFGAAKGWQPRMLR